MNRVKEWTVVQDEQSEGIAYIQGESKGFEGVEIESVYKKIIFWGKKEEYANTRDVKLSFFLLPRVREKHLLNICERKYMNMAFEQNQSNDR